RVDYLYQAAARLAALAGPGDEKDGPTRPLKTPKDLLPFVRLAADARGRVDAALDDDLNTPVALAVLGEVAKAANELADLAQKRRKDKEIAQASPSVARSLRAALLGCAEPLGLLRATPEAYRARTEPQRLA